MLEIINFPLMETKTIKRYSKNVENSINADTESNSYPDDIKAKIILKDEFILQIDDPKMRIGDLRSLIKRKFLLENNDYELYIGEKNISYIPIETLITTLFSQFNTNKLSIKATKNSFDVKKQILDYEDFLSKKITAKEEEINLFNLEYENLKNDLSNIA